MLEQLIKSIMAYLNTIVPMNTYIQRIPVQAQYPLYLVNKVDIKTEAINSYYYVNHINIYIRMFSEDEVKLKNDYFNLNNALFDVSRVIPILNQDGTKSGRSIRFENIESIEIPTDVNEIYCVELNFEFDTTQVVNVQEFALLQDVYVSKDTTSPDNTTLNFKIGG